MGYNINKLSFHMLEISCLNFNNKRILDLMQNTGIAYVFLNVYVPTGRFHQELNAQKNIHIALRKVLK